MGDTKPTRAELLQELAELRQRNMVLEASQAECKQEAQPRESLEKFRRLVEGFTQGVVVHRDFRPLFVNQALADILGYESSDDILHLTTLVPIFAPHERDRLIHYNRARLRGEQSPAQYEYQAIRKDGSLIWLDCKATPIMWEGESAIQSSIFDISERKRVEMQLRASETRFRDLVVGSIQGIVIHRDFKPLFANQAYASILGYDTPEDILSLDSILPVLAPVEQPRLINYIQDRRKGAEVSEHQEHQAIRKDGVPIWLDVKVREVIWNGEPAIQATIFDITDRKQTEVALQQSYQSLEQQVMQRTADLEETNRRLVREIHEHQQSEAALRTSEARYRDLFENASDAVYTVDFTTKRFTSFNKAAERIIGYSRDDVVGKNVYSLFMSPSSAALSREMGARKDEGVAWTQYKTEIITKAGQRRVLEVSTWHLHKNGQPIEVQGIARDVTVQREMELALRNSEERARRLNTELEQRVAERTRQLEAANKELEAFAYSVSHDLRAPLRAIEGFSRILMEEYGPTLATEIQHYLNRIHNNAQQMDQLIRDLLIFSRLGRKPIVKQSVVLDDLVRQVLTDLQPEYNKRQVDIAVDALPVCLADPVLLKQVFVNLFSNALKFTRQQALTRIVVGCEKAEHECTFFIQDNGVGFDMRYRDKLFGVFQRLHAAEEFEGTGVGLAIVQRIVLRHGGRVWGESEVGHGATFYFTLGEENRRG